MLKNKMVPTLALIFALSALILIGQFISPAPAYAFQVDPLPGDNLVANPWFRSADDPNQSGFDSWENENNYWTLSQKESNPSPDLVVSGRCGDEPDYCGTAAKLAADDGNAQVGVDSYLYQVIAANPSNSNTRLRFSTHWVAHYVDPFEVNIYGAAGQNGPWTFVWQPVNEQVLSLEVPPPGEDQSWLWEEFTSTTPMTETTLTQGYAYYKLEILANLPEPDGFKLTGVYFSAVPESVDFSTHTYIPFVSYLADGQKHSDLINRLLEQIR